MSYIAAADHYYTTEDGETVIDLISGCYNVPLGHCSDEETSAILRAAHFPSSTYGGMKKPAENLAAELNDSLSENRIWNTYSSGSEAVERAVMMAMKPGGTLVCFEGAFHGKSHFTSKFHYHTWWDWPFNVVTIPIGRLDLLPSKFDAVIFEPVQGWDGSHFSKRQQRELANACKNVGAVLIADEIFCGLGRTGSATCSKAANPDILLIGKGLAGALPCTAIGTAREITPPLGHSSTFHGNHFGQRVANDLVRTTVQTGRIRSAAFEPIYKALFPDARVFGTIAFIPKHNINPNPKYVITDHEPWYKLCPSYSIQPEQLIQYLEELKA